MADGKIVTVKGEIEPDSWASARAMNICCFAKGSLIWSTRPCLWMNRKKARRKRQSIWRQEEEPW